MNDEGLGTLFFLPGMKGKQMQFLSRHAKWMLKEHSVHHQERKKYDVCRPLIHKKLGVDTRGIKWKVQDNEQENGKHHIPFCLLFLQDCRLIFSLMCMKSVSVKQGGEDERRKKRKGNSLFAGVWRVSHKSLSFSTTPAKSFLGTTFHENILNEYWRDIPEWILVKEATL